VVAYGQVFTIPVISSEVTMPRALLLCGATIILAAACANPSNTMLYVAEVATVGTYTGQEGSSAGLASLPSTLSNVSFYAPTGMAFDSKGNLYISDNAQYILRIRASDHNMEIYAGTGVATANPAKPTNGARLSADFNIPQGIAFDSEDNLYIADNSNYLIRKITAKGVVSTLAGSGSFGFVNAQGVNASFHFPDDVAVDSKFNVYVADLYNHAIRKITKGGSVSTFVNASGVQGYRNGPREQALVNFPQGVAVDSSDNVYFTDENNAVRKVSADGNVTTVAGPPPTADGALGASGYVDGKASLARFTGPTSIVVRPDGSIYVNDAGDYVIRRIADGYVQTLAGVSGTRGFNDGAGLQATFTMPSRLAFDSKGVLYLLEGNDPYNTLTYGNVIRTLTLKSAL
jgi:sugar lactone lactonase YvrE